MLKLNEFKKKKTIRSYIQLIESILIEQITGPNLFNVHDQETLLRLFIISQTR